MRVRHGLLYVLLVLGVVAAAVFWRKGVVRGPATAAALCRHVVDAS